MGGVASPPSSPTHCDPLVRGLPGFGAPVHIKSGGTLVALAGFNVQTARGDAGVQLAGTVHLKLILGDESVIADVAVHGQCKDGITFAGVLASAQLGDQEVQVTIAVDQAPHEPEGPRIGLLVQLRHGVDLGSLPGLRHSGTASGVAASTVLPLLAGAELKLGTFDGFMDVPHSDGVVAEESFRKELMLESGCTFAAAGGLGMLSNFTESTGYVHGFIDFASGSFRLTVAVVGSAGLSTGIGLHLEASQVSVHLLRDAGLVCALHRHHNSTESSNCTQAQRWGEAAAQSGRRLLGRGAAAAAQHKQAHVGIVFSAAPVRFSLTGKGVLVLPGGMGKGTVELEVALTKDKTVLQAKGPAKVLYAPPRCPHCGPL